MVPPLVDLESMTCSWSIEMIWATFLSMAFASAPVNKPTLKYAQAVEIEQAFTYNWTAERTEISMATILVVEVSPGKIGQPQVGAPVLYVGNTPAARIHPGGLDHHIVVYVSGHPDLSKTPIFWGPDELPERVTKSMGEQYVATMGGAPVAVSTLSAVTQPTITVADQTTLIRHMSTLIDTYAPKDRAFSEGIRVTIPQ